MAVISYAQNPSLNEIAHSLAARVDKPNDTGLIAELKVIINYKRTQAIHDWLVQMPQTWTYFLQSFIVDTEIISEDNEAATTPGGNAYIVRTVCDIPEPLRDNKIKREWQLFDFVGSPSGYVPYQWYQPEYLDINRHARYTADRIKWYWKNSRIYLVNTSAEEPIQVRGVFEDALWMDRLDACTPVVPDIFDDEPYPIPRELLNHIIKDILSTELQSGSVPNQDRQKQGDAKVDTVTQTQHINQ